MYFRIHNWGHLRRLQIKSWRFFDCFQSRHRDICKFRFWFDMLKQSFSKFIFNDWLFKVTLFVAIHPLVRSKLSIFQTLTIYLIKIAFLSSVKKIVGNYTNLAFSSRLVYQRLYLSHNGFRSRSMNLFILHWSSYKCCWFFICVTDIIKLANFHFLKTLKSLHLFECLRSY